MELGGGAWGWMEVGARFSNTRNKCTKVNKSVYTAKSRQRHYKTLKNILLHVSKQALKDMYMLNYGTIKKAVYYSSFVSNSIVYFSLEYL